MGIRLFVSFILLAGAAVAQKPSPQSLVKEFPIEFRWDKPNPTVVPEQRGVIAETAFYGDSPDRPALRPGAAPYTPLQPAGFGMRNGTRYFNRPIAFRGNTIAAGDRPELAITRLTGSSWAPKLRFHVVTATGGKWLDLFSEIDTEHRPGLVRYRCRDAQLKLEIILEATPSLDEWGTLAKFTIVRPIPSGTELRWVFGDMAREPIPKGNAGMPLPIDFRDSPVFLREAENYVELGLDRTVSEQWRGWLDELFLERVQFFVGADWKGHQIGATDAEGANLGEFGRGKATLATGKASIQGSGPWTGFVVVLWGGPEQSERVIQLHEGMRRVNQSWSEAIWEEWYKNYLGRAQQPEQKFLRHLQQPEREFGRSLEFWNLRQRRVWIETPDAEFNSWANWLFATQEYTHWPVGQIAGIDLWAGGWLHIQQQYSGWDHLGAHDEQEAWLRLYALTERRGWIGLYMAMTPWMAGDRWARYPQESRDWPNYGEEDLLTHYISYVRTNWRWTGNIQFLKDIWPHVKRIVARELRQNDKDGDGLFSASHSYWGPEGYPYGPKTGLATALGMGMLRDAVEMAGAVGDQESARAWAARLQISRQNWPQLWDAATGIVGHRGRADVFHKHTDTSETFFSIFGGVVDESQAYQMVRFVRANMLSEVFPGVARQWLNDYFGGPFHDGPLPDVHSNMVAAAAMAGDWEHYYPVMKTLIRACFFNSWPGMEAGAIYPWGAGGALFTDHNDSRMPALHMIGRGIFGVDPDIPSGRLNLSPTLPPAWDQVRFHTPDLTFDLKRQLNQVQVRLQTPRALAKTLRLPVPSAVLALKVDGRAVPPQLEEGVNRSWLIVDLPLGTDNSVSILLRAEKPRVVYDNKAARTVPLRVKILNIDKSEIIDPQGVFAAKAQQTNDWSIIPGRTGIRTAFVRVQQGTSRMLLPLDLDISEPLAIVNSQLEQNQSVLSVSLENRSGADLKGPVTLLLGGASTAALTNVRHSWRADVKFFLTPAQRAALTPGSNPFRIEAGGIGAHGVLVDWNLLKGQAEAEEHLRSRAIQADLTPYQNEIAGALYMTKFYYDHWHLGLIDYPVTLSATYEHHDIHLNNPKLDSAYFRSLPGIPFFLEDERRIGGVFQKHVAGGPRNVVVVSNWKPWIYPSNITIQIGGLKLKKAYLLAHMFHRGQKSYFPMVELVAHYTDGSQTLRQLIPPYSFRCRYDLVSVNGHPYRPELTPAGLDLGPGKSERGASAKPSEIIDLPLDPHKPVDRIEVRSVSSESLIAIFGLTFVRSE